MSSTAFTENEFDLAYPPGVEKTFWTKARLSILRLILHANKLTNKKILEIGCGKGVVVQALRNKKIDCIGAELANIEPIPEVKNFIFTRQDATRLNETIRNSIEVILLLDVIEHIENDADFLNSIKSAFPKLCVLLIMVPARKEIWSNYDEFYGHFRRYNLSMMKELASKTNSELTYHSYFFHGLFLAARITLPFSNNKRSVKVKSPKGIFILLHSLLALCFVIEYYLLPGSIYGSSIVALYKTD